MLSWFITRGHHLEHVICLPKWWGNHFLTGGFFPAMWPTKMVFTLGKFHHDRTLFSRALESWFILGELSQNSPTFGVWAGETEEEWPNISGLWINYCNLPSTKILSCFCQFLFMGQRRVVDLKNGRPSSRVTTTKFGSRLCCDVSNPIINLGGLCHP